MTPQNEQSMTTSANDRFMQAEEIISQTIAHMDNENHVEYGSSIERNATPPKWKRWLNQLLR
jgi:hypothetical protein